MMLGISGKKGHGKDTVAKIIQYITLEQTPIFDKLKIQTRSYEIGYLKQNFISYIKDCEYSNGLGGWENKKLANQPKDITCMILGCTREQLEDSIFKETPLGEEWHCMQLSGTETLDDTQNIITYEHWQTLGIWEQSMYHHRKMTPRMFMQLLATDFGRNMIHPDIWINSLMKDYKPTTCINQTIWCAEDQEEKCPKGFNYGCYPNWAITDVRFPNEVEAIHKRSGIVLRVFNPRIPKVENEHYSETALDDYEFAHYLTNDGTIEDMIEPIKDFLKFNKLI